MLVQKPQKSPDFPIHRLNTAQTKAWVSFENSRALIASNLAKKYPKTGVGLLSATLYLFVLIDPRGKYRLLKAPLVQYEMFQVANAPYHWEECACRNYYDPEVLGPWRLRGEKAGHHPFCQFNKTAVPVYSKCFDSATRRVEQGQEPQTRPDEWFNANNNDEVKLR